MLLGFDNSDINLDCSNKSLLKFYKKKSFPMKNDSKDKQIVPIIDKRKKELSKLESLFNYRIKRVKRLKENMSVATKQLHSLHNETVTTLLPLNKQVTEKQVVLVKALVAIFDEKVIKVIKGKEQREKLEELILYFLEDLIFEKEQEGLNELYERFSKQSVEEAEKEAEREGKEKLIYMMDMMGMPLNEEEKEKLMQEEEDEDFIATLHERLSEENMENNKSGFYEKFGYQEPKKSQRQLEREEEKNKELENISKTVKQVYKELMKELHPDKESDDIKRLEKTSLVQEITEAYRNDDLFTLLSIQLAQLDTADNTNLSEDKVNYFNTMLLKQAQELEQQKREMGLKVGLPRILVDTLGKKEFRHLSRRMLKESQEEIENTLKYMDNQIKKIKAKDKKYIKIFIDENYEELFERSPFDFSMMSEIFR